MVGRFAPSPTGDLHLGTARTALLAWARARAAGGRFLLRIEDLDRPRCVPGAEAALLADLAWLGLDWDGAPWRQSERAGSYAAALALLQRTGHAYACTCSRKEIEAVASAPHGDEGPLYPGTCRAGLSHPGRATAWRLRMDAVEPFVDGACGPQAGWRDDFVLQRADGAFSYQLACAVDDAAQGVTEVVRADDLLSSASRQQALLRALGLPVPAWHHGPLLLGPTGERLSKRHGSVSIAAHREAGVSAAALRGRLAESLGWADAGESLTPSDWVDRCGRPLRPQPMHLEL